MYVCMHILISLNTYACIHVYAVNICTRVYLFMYMGMRHIFIYVGIMYPYIYIYNHICMSACKTFMLNV